MGGGAGGLGVGRDHPSAQGFEYSTVAGQCCGECVQTSCLAPDGQLVQVREHSVSAPALQRPS